MDYQRDGRHIGDAAESLRILTAAGVVAVTEIGDTLTPVGVICTRCGEPFVFVPDRWSPTQPFWENCQRCTRDDNRAARAGADAVFAAAGLRLIGTLSGQNVPQPVECLTCGTRRTIRYREALNGTAPLCWVCTYGIRPDEPHRVYLFRFPHLGVLKVGITHNRHNRRLFDHTQQGGVLLDAIVVSDRAAARAVEAWVLACRAQWRQPNVGPDNFPQGGWTEAWTDLPDTQIDLRELGPLLDPHFDPTAQSEA